jgi:PTH1 family peptidyl-tRNA hydrolase
LKVRKAKKSKKRPKVRKLRKNLKKLNRNGRRYLVIGLGNPGEKYRNTRHNAGFLVLEEIADRYNVSFFTQRDKTFSWGSVRLNGCILYLFMPLTYMNRSGVVLGSALRKTGCTYNNLIVVCDSLDLLPGTIRIKRKGGSAGQKGLESIIRTAGTDEFTRIFIGIGRPEHKSDIVRYVLEPPEKEELAEFSGAVRRAADALVELTGKDLQQVMNEYNRKP